MTRLYLAAGLAAALVASHGTAWLAGGAAVHARWQAASAADRAARARAEGRAAALADALERDRQAEAGRRAAALAEVDAMPGAGDVALPADVMRAIAGASR
jgi:hypothetical protein